MERYVATQFYKADSPESRILRESGIAPSEFVLAADAQATIAALQAERDTARRRVDELEAREVDVVMLREDLEQRTAELEAVNQRVMDERNLSNSWMKKHDELLAKVHKSGQFGAVVVQDVLKERDTLQAKLECVRGERDEARDRLAREGVR